MDKSSRPPSEAGSRRSLASGSIHDSQMRQNASGGSMRQNVAGASNAGDGPELNGLFSSENIEPHHTSLVNVERLIRDRIHCIRGVVSLSDDTILILRDNQLLVFDCYFHFLCQLPVLACLEKGQGIVVVEKDTVAVLEKDYISFFQTEFSGIKKIEYEIQLNWEGDGLAYNGSFFAIACKTHSRDNACIEIINKEGKPITTIREKICKGQFYPPLIISGYIAMDSDNEERVYVSDTYHERIVCLSFEGTKIWELVLYANAYGISVLNHCLLVSTLNGQAIRQVSKDGKFVKQIVKESVLLEQPRFVCWLRKRHQLIISCCTPGFPHCTMVQF